MTRLLDRPLRKVAQTVLRTFGTNVIIRRVTPGAYNPATRVVSPTTGDTTVRGRIDDYTERELRDSVKAGDRKVLIAAADLSYTPEPQKDKVVIASLEYDVVRVVPDLATDDPAIYTLQVRR